MRASPAVGEESAGPAHVGLCVFLAGDGEVGEWLAVEGARGGELPAAAACAGRSLAEGRGGELLPGTWYQSTWCCPGPVGVQGVGMGGQAQCAGGPMLAGGEEERLEARRAGG